MWKRIGTNSLQGPGMKLDRIRPNTAVARYIELTAADMDPDVDTEGNKRAVARLQFPSIHPMPNPTITWGRVYYLQFHPKTGRGSMIVEGIPRVNLFDGMSPITEGQAAGEYVVRIYELSGQTAH